MNMFRVLMMAVMACVIVINGYAATYNTTERGYWNDSGTWEDGIIPPFESYDTINIFHAVVLTSDLILMDGSHLEIDSVGALCGHRTITSESSSSLITYGILEIDILEVPGGKVDLLAGQSIFNSYGLITNGGSMSINGVGLSVGSWFQCVEIAFKFILDVSDNQFDNTSISSYQQSILIEGTGQVDVFTIQGQRVHNSTITGNTTLSFSKGIYLVRVVNEGGSTVKKVYLN